VAGVEVTDASFEDEVLRSELPVIVSFGAPWCRPCKAIQPWLDAIAETHSGRIRLVSLDIDGNLGVPARYGVLAVPTVILFSNGEARTTLAGARPRRVYEEAVAALLA
jgi:thioredoxin 1